MGSSILDSYTFTHQFKLNYSETENGAVGHFVSSPDISAGGHLWRINCYPRVCWEDNMGNVSIFLKLLSKSKDKVRAIFEASVMDRDGALSLSHRKREVHDYPPGRSGWGWSCFVSRSVLESLYVTDGSFIILVAAKVVRNNLIDVPPSDIGNGNNLIDVPPSDIGSHLGLLLDCRDSGSDVSFVVDGVNFPAHRAVLAARSPVFKAQLLGSMADANLSSITLHDIPPAIFKIMLRFMYTDAFPADAELGESPDEMLQQLLAAADRFVLDRLKLLCARKLWDNVSVETVAATLICAETYNCLQLKKKCIDFFGEGKDFKTEAVLTDGFFQLAQQFPSIVDELRSKVRA